ncbi:MULTISPECIES: alpha/beta fold hydrolase [unclassified Cellulophaga]|uniref:alpha/beta fold hydrolase n=1 Tax=unclassified Cellulophaga TaxID=2634405 RepID=UPI0026E1C735|nr:MULTISPECIES: alpha/beta hydrolase [unclassified Cellulophaga]MDO6490606.1 alpha/beta hydrolase [Cellulophaga sp. 2_MG-2023]MDO6494200.1 alpha/beta hydrolase [Cellulophaga sp. 3_MG-2023]
MKKMLSKIIPKVYGAYFNVLSVFSKKKAAKKAFYLFCTPRKGKVLPFQSEFLNKAKKEVVHSNNIDLQVYEWTGEKETILLLHGWESNVFRWRNLISFLKEEGYNIIAFDAPAHGNSKGQVLHVPIYTEVTQTLITKYQPKHIIGHSVGGMTTLYNNYKYSNPSVDKLVILGAPSEFYTILLNYQNMLKFNNKVFNELKKFIIEQFGFKAEDFSISEYVKKNKKKGLLVHDKLDFIAPCSDSELVHKNWTNSKLITTKGYGHSLHQDEVSNAVISFLKED